MSVELEEDFGVIDFLTDEKRGADLLPEFLKYSDNIVAMIKTFIPEIQELHDAQSDFYSTLNIFEAVGSQLDDIFGNILDTDRETGQTDDSYRADLLAAVTKLAKSGDIQTMKSIFRNLSGASSVSLSEQQPASFSMTAFGVSTLTETELEKIRATLKTAKQGGNSMILAVSEVAQSATFSLTGETDAGNGLGDGVLSQGF